MPSVEIREIYDEGRRINDRIRGGKVREKQVITARKSLSDILYEASGDENIILFQRWRGNGYGTIVSEMYAFLPARHGSGEIPGVKGRLDILMYLHTWRTVERFFPLLDHIIEENIWLSIPPEWWIVAGSYIDANQSPPPLTAESFERLKRAVV
jgi:hypothetical protein